MEGRGRETLDAAQKVSTKHSHEEFQEPGFGFPHLLQTMPIFGMVRFGRWDDLLKAADPGEELRFVQVIRHFGRGYAFLAKKDVKQAAVELDQLRKAAKDPKLTELKIFDLNDLATLSAIAENLLAAEIAAGRKNTAQAVALARKAVEIEDNLKYSEPPDWPLPPRHFLGAILLGAGRARDAEKVYREDLARHRGNGWALRGLERSLRAQGRADEAAKVEAQFGKAWERADTEITSSRI